ncbi:hypothetical protein [Luteimonas sp. MC1750]|uniref:hypothetical protein n=1 Tax=Luteimonas sp. MC1750 TaxID=2799326 RepID=UPI0018F078EC|nr:hypothetical protein [Luteimonas sp. MC1750]
MEDALSPSDAIDASLRYRIVRIRDGVAIEVGTSDDHLLDARQALSIVRVALERGDEVSIEVPLEP